MTELAQDLKLSIWRDGDQIRIKLVDELQMLETEVCHQINVTTLPSRQYHIREAAVIAMRRLISEAFKSGMISGDLGSSMPSKPATAATSSTPSETSLELS